MLRQKSLDPDIRDIPTVVISSRDPTNEPIVSNALTVTQGGGLSAWRLLDCVLTISQILSPAAQPAHRGQP